MNRVAWRVEAPTSKNRHRQNLPTQIKKLLLRLTASGLLNKSLATVRLCLLGESSSKVLNGSGELGVRMKILSWRL